jgi:hypothetical protein
MLNNRVSPKGMHYSIVTAFNGKQDHTRSNKEVPPKDAQLLEGPNQRYEHQLTEKEMLERESVQKHNYDYLDIDPQHIN